MIRALERAGFRLTHIRGSHHYLRREGEQKLVVVPSHGDRDLPVGTLRAIVRQADLSVAEFERLLKDRSS